MRNWRFSTNISQYFENDARYGHSYNRIRTENRMRSISPYSMVSFWMTLSDLEWFSEIFNDTKHRAASLRQPSFQKWPLYRAHLTPTAQCLFLDRVQTFLCCSVPYKSVYQQSEASTCLLSFDEVVCPAAASTAHSSWESSPSVMWRVWLTATSCAYASVVT